MRLSEAPYIVISLPPRALNFDRSGSSVLMLANAACSATPRSCALANWSYDRFFQPSAPLPVALRKLGVARVEFCSSSATRSVAIVVGVVGPKMLPKFGIGEVPTLAPRG